MAGSDVTGATIWLVAVVGAGTIMVAPATPWLIPVELIGAMICLVATAALLRRCARH